MPLDLRDVAALPDDEACLDWLWTGLFSPDGDYAHCPSCRRTRKFHRVRSRRSFSCDVCGHHIHPTAFTVLRGSSAPLKAWLTALATVEAGGPGSLPAPRELSRRLGVSLSTARRMHERLRPVADGEPWVVPGVGVEASPDAGDTQDPQGARRAARSRPGIASRETEIVVAACRSIATRGLDATRIQDVAAIVGVSPAAVIYHFGSREQLLLRALSHVVERASRRRDEVTGSSASPSEKLMMLVALNVPADPVVRDEVVLWSEFFRRTTGQLAIDSEAIAVRSRDPFFSVIEEGVSSGAFTIAGDVQDCVETILGTIDGLTVAAILGRPWMTPERMMRLLGEMIVSMLGLEREPFMSRVAEIDLYRLTATDAAADSAVLLEPRDGVEEEGDAHP